MAAKRNVTLACRISRKISDGNFGSVEVSHELYVETEFEDAKELPDKAKSLRQMVAKMVDEGLAERTGKKAPAPKATEVSAVAQLLEDW